MVAVDRVALHQRDDHEAAAVGQRADLERHPRDRRQAAAQEARRRQQRQRDQRAGAPAPRAAPARSAARTARRAAGSTPPRGRPLRRRPHLHRRTRTIAPGSCGRHAPSSPAPAPSPPGRRPRRPRRPAPAPAPRTQSGGDPARNTAARIRMAISPGMMNASPPTAAPARPRTRHAQKIASWVDAGPGSRLQAARASSNSAGASHLRRSTHSARNSEMCAGGPPKPMHPIRPHSRSTVRRPGCSAASVTRR